MELNNSFAHCANKLPTVYKPPTEGMLLMQRISEVEADN